MKYGRYTLLLGLIALCIIAPTPKYTTGPLGGTGGSGEANTASNLGGGLDNFSGKSGVDLQFNSFDTNDFTLTAHKIFVNLTKWALRSVTTVNATADLAGNPAILEGADITAAIAACGSGDCQVNLVAGTYVDVCWDMQRSNTVVVGHGGAILKPYLDLDNCTATLLGQTIFVHNASHVKLLNFEMDGGKQFVSYTNSVCAQSSTSSCTIALWIGANGTNVSDIEVRDLYIHDFVRDAITAGGDAPDGAQAVTVANNRVEALGCNQSSTSCGCGAGDPGGCRGWNAAPDVGGGNKSNATAISFNVGANNGIASGNTVDLATKAGVGTFSGGVLANSPSNIQLLGNTITNTATGIVINGVVRSVIEGNRVSLSSSPGGSGDAGAGVLIHDFVADLDVRHNYIYDNDSSGLVVINDGPGGVRIIGNKITNNCLDHDDGGNIFIASGATTQARDLRLENNEATGSAGCTYALQSSNARTGSAYLGAIQIIGGNYATGSTSVVLIDNANIFVQGTKVTGNLTFGANSHGIAQGLTVSGSTTNTGGVCILDNDSTPITDTCSNAASLYQPLDSDLTSIAALSTTSFGRGLLDDADAAAGRTSLGVVIGTNVQAHSSILDTIAARPDAGSYVVSKMLSSDSATDSTSSSFTDVTGLSVTVANGETWTWACDLNTTAAAITTGLKLSMNGPATTTLDYCLTYGFTASAIRLSCQTAYDTATTYNSSAGNTTHLTSRLAGSATFSAGASLIVRMDTDVNGSGVIVRRGSFCTFTRL